MKYLIILMGAFIMRSNFSCLILFFLSITFTAQVAAQNEQQSAVSFSADYFTRYQATSALDMVNRVPGFTLDDGGDKRGFGGAAGNVLINDRRPSTKQDAPSAILGRIPASLVEKIELIRTRMRDIDLQGHAEVVNVTLKADAPAIIQWEFYLRQNLDSGPSPKISTSMADRWQDIEYNVGFDLAHNRVGDPGVIETYDGNGQLTEIRTDENLQKGPTANIYLNASSWLGNTFIQVNSKAGLNYRDLVQTLSRVPQITGQPRQEVITTKRRNNSLDLGIDAERILNADLLGKAIFLYSLLDQEPESSQQNINAAGQQTRFQLQQDDTTSIEAIARLEFYWAGFEDHAIQVDMEYAKNILDNTQVFTDDTGAGAVVIDVDGGNVRVEEDRWNFLAQDRWSLGNFDLNYGLGLERSTLSQTGDSIQQRSFTFIKPSTVLTYTPVRGNQTRLGIEREVSQLRFSDFVSAAVFEDDNVVLGNPDLQPESTWIAELSHERRFENDSVVKLTAFHHWITDVLDLLPVSATDAVPGNIGDGRRWGLVMETTQPLVWIGLENAQITFRARWQDSTVLDPATGMSRVLSGEGGYRSDVGLRNENKWAYRAEYRQDFEAERVSWGMSLGERAKRPVFKVNELDIFNEGHDLTAFIETSRWFGLNIKIEGFNLLDTVQKRDRTVYVGERSGTPIQRRELRDGTNGARFVLTVNGSF